MSNYPVGIYLGPNDCSISIIGRNGHKLIVIDYDGNSMPSIVSFTKTEILGDSAKNIKIPESTIYGIGKIFGKLFYNPDV